jgi:hypothetical protein
MLLCLLPVTAESLESKNNCYLRLGSYERLEFFFGKAGFLPGNENYVQVGKRNLECERLDFTKIKGLAHEKARCNV